MPRRAFLRHEGRCSLAQWRRLLHGSHTGDTHQRAEGCSAAAFPAPLEVHCEWSPALAANNKTFAWHGCGVEVVTWGNPENGGDSSQVQKQRNAQHIQATGSAFAAILVIRGCCDLGSSQIWRRQQPGARAAEKCPAHPSN